MNTSTLAEVVEMANVSSATAKSLKNRLESALGKEGSAHARLSMAGSSLLNLADKSPDDDRDTVYFLGVILKYAGELAKEIHAPAPKAKKETRETWHDEDSAEGQAILAKTSRKTRSSKQETAPAIDAKAIAEIVAQVLASR